MDTSLPLHHPVRLFVTIAGMFGWRLDKGPAQAILTLLGISLTVVISSALTGTTLTHVLGAGTDRPPLQPALLYLAGTLALYYVSHALVFRFGIHRALRKRFGDEKAYGIYSVVLGVVYFNIVWSQVPFLAAAGGTLDLNLSSSNVLAASVLLAVVPFSVKIWATLHLGLDSYFYRDMFLEQPGDAPVTSGPYAFFTDPMYSVGYCQVYAAPLFARSFEGLVVGVLMHASIWLFHLVVERPFVRKMYGGASDLGVRPASQIWLSELLTECVRGAREGAEVTLWALRRRR